MRITAESVATSLRFWRPVPREAADIICGEGTVTDVPLCMHEALQVMLPASTLSVVDARGGTVVVRPGQIYVAAPLELNGARSFDGATCAVRMLLVSPEMLRGVEQRIPALWRGVSAGRRQSVVDDPAVYAELWTLIGEMGGPLVSLSCCTRLQGILTRVLTALAAQPATLPGRSEPAGIRRVCEHLRAHTDESVSLDELADIACLSKFYLLRAFRRAHGVTPHAYQMQLRLAHAWRCIVNGAPLTRATYDAGFADQSHLTRRFAAAFGVTPARYARQLAVPPGAQRAATIPSAARALRLDATLMDELSSSAA